MNRATVLLVLSCSLAACVGQIHDAPNAVPADVVMRVDSGTPRDVPVQAMDVVTATDTPVPMDRTFVIDNGPPPADVPAPPPDVPTTPVDSGTYSCPYSPPLSGPIAGCMPAVPASSSDPHEDCVRRINQFRCECQHLPPLMRWRDGEACADMMAEYDAMHAGSPHAGFIARICAGGYGQNECPGWPSVDSTISGCLQQMWDEGPGDFYGPPAHGHYINMSSTSFSMVACGFYMGSGGVYAVQNFQ